MYIYVCVCIYIYIIKLNEVNYLLLLDILDFFQQFGNINNAAVNIVELKVFSLF